MKFSERWLRQWANPQISSAELQAQLNLAGLEVDGIEAAAPPLDGVVVAEIMAIEKHPEADRLNICQVAGSGDENLQIICGAANARLGLKTALVTIGSELPGGLKIKKAKLRGVESFGMLCSAKELGLAEAADGILELPADAPVGSTLYDYLELDDILIEVDLTPNRGDCLSVAGVAREVAAINRMPLTPVAIPEIAATLQDTLDVELQAPEACSQYLGRVIRNINPQAETPLWMQESLRRSGLRPISPTVDITNYIMLELGQPMHAFDLDKLSGKIVVRMAHADEELELLDGSSQKLRDDTLVIADAEKALAMAGIMGGMASSVQNETRHIFLESAFFHPLAIAGKSRSYSMHTDSSHRFERGVDPQLQQLAMQRATDLTLQIVGGEAGPIIVKTAAEHRQSNPQVVLRHARIERLLGVSISHEEVEQYLRALGMQLQAQDGGSWTVQAPSYRFDINIEADLIEEIGRMIGYDHIEGQKEAAHINMDACSESDAGIDQFKDLLVHRGYFESVSYAFVDPALQQKLKLGLDAIDLSNPIASDMSQMRTTLLPGLLKSALHNLNRQQNRVRLFEYGLCFIVENGKLQQRNRLALLLTGPRLPQQWSGDSKAVDFYDMKGDLEAVLELAGIQAEVSFERSEKSCLHPGQAAELLMNGNSIGFCGAIDPRLADDLGLNQTVYFAEVHDEVLHHSAVPAFKPLSRFPSVRRDISIQVEPSVAVQDLLTAIKDQADDLLQDVLVFDVYTPENVTKSRKSVALGLILQDFSRTLTDSDVEQSVTGILQVLEQQFQASLREA